MTSPRNRAGVLGQMKTVTSGVAQNAARRLARNQTPIVPPDNVASRAMVLVIAIMTFLSCLTLGGVTLVRDTATTWQTQISREATIQIKPADGLDMEEALAQAQQVAAGYTGVRAASIVDREATVRLLEPWLGSGLEMDTLPVPRLVIVTIDTTTPPDFESMRAELQQVVPEANLDDHRTWVDRLVAMATTTVTIGMAILALMLSATALTVIFATRGAMSGNVHVIEVLHFVGAEAPFIAREFRRHFLVAGLRGAIGGGIAASIVFVLFSWWSSRNLGTPEGDQASALFGNFAIGSTGYAGVALIAVLIAVLAAVTSHITVIAYLRRIES
jgi:cell division transport system permease protein